MAKSKKGLGDLAVMFGNLEGRVAVCVPTPSNMQIKVRDRKTGQMRAAKKICYPRGYPTLKVSSRGTSSYTIKRGKRAGTKVTRRTGFFMNVPKRTAGAGSAAQQAARKRFADAARGKGKIASGSKLS